ncbi:YxlC family protein [Cytobacillus horneckiae]|uniref:YxlC family protein n=1 Tax=Cytobacillus horneckiae TaxID=549687 RepID=UPI0034CFD78C
MKKDNNEQAVIDEITKSLNILDAHPVHIPDASWFEAFVEDQQKKLRKTFIRDVCVFLFVALFILSGLLFTLFQMPYLFIVIQIASIIFVALYSFIRYRKQVAPE